MANIVTWRAIFERTGEVVRMVFPRRGAPRPYTRRQNYLTKRPKRIPVSILRSDRMNGLSENEFY